MRRLARLPATPVALAALAAVAYLVFDPPNGDTAAAVYRSDVFSREGFAIWDGGWYAGHHELGYSILFPALGSLLGPRLVAALAAVAAAALFDRLARPALGAGGTAASLVFAFGTASSLLAGRLAFALAIPFGLATLLLARRGLGIAAVALAALTSLASPVAGVFVAVVGAAWALAERERLGAWIATAALAPPLVFAVVFPEGGHQPLAGINFWVPVAGLIALFFELPAERRTLRLGVVLYALAYALAFVIPTPLGGNVARLGALVGPALVAGTLWPRRALVLAALAPLLVWWQWSAPIRDSAATAGDASRHASYFTPLLDFLSQREDAPFRIEIPFTRSHWESARVAPQFPLARGWERQLDIADNELFYEGTLTAARYRRWLDENAVRFVALPDVRLDNSARTEARLIRGGLPYLRPVWASAHWRVFEVQDAKPMSSGPTLLTALRGDGFDITFERPASTIVRVRFTPYWGILGPRGCVARAPGGWTRVTGAPPSVTVGIDFSLGRIFSRGRRCAT